MLCLSRFELYSRWVPLIQPLSLTVNLIYSGYCITLDSVSPYKGIRIPESEKAMHV